MTHHHPAGGVSSVLPQTVLQSDKQTPHSEIVSIQNVTDTGFHILDYKKEVLKSRSLIRALLYSTLNICCICACKKSQLRKLFERWREKDAIMWPHLWFTSGKWLSSQTNRGKKKQLSSKTGWFFFSRTITAIFTLQSSSRNQILPLSQSFVSLGGYHATHWSHFFL